jgi:hypothetical protein
MTDARRLLMQATESYLRLAREIALSGSRSEADDALANLTRLWQGLSARERRDLDAQYQELERQLKRRVATPQAPHHQPTSIPRREP